MLPSILALSQTNININFAPQDAHVFSPGFISTGCSERDFAMSPDGQEIYYTVQSPQGLFQTIVFIKKGRDGKWSDPEIVPFAGHYSDLEPAFSSDGKTLFFASNRPTSGTDVKDFDIWKVEKTKNSWSAPINLGNTVNTEKDEFYPSVTKSGNLYFTASYKNGVGKEDIFVSSWKDGNYQAAQPLDTMINSSLYEFNAFVTPEEDVIIFTGYGRKDDLGKGDLYMSLKGPNGKWQKAKNLKSINSSKLDYCPSISPDGKMLFFTSERINIQNVYKETPKYKDLIKGFDKPQNGGGDIYWVSFENLKELYK